VVDPVAIDARVATTRPSKRTTMRSGHSHGRPLIWSRQISKWLLSVSRNVHGSPPPSQNSGHCSHESPASKAMMHGPRVRSRSCRHSIHESNSAPTSGSEKYRAMHSRGDTHSESRSSVRRAQSSIRSEYSSGDSSEAAQRQPGSNDWYIVPFSRSPATRCRQRT
jgi:hypothetical protein